MAIENLVAIPVLDEEDKLCGIAIIHDIIDEYIYHKKGKVDKIFKWEMV